MIEKTDVWYSFTDNKLCYQPQPHFNKLQMVNVQGVSFLYDATMDELHLVMIDHEYHHADGEPTCYTLIMLDKVGKDRIGLQAKLHLFFWTALTQVSAKNK